MDTFTLVFLYGFIGMMSLLAPYLLLVFLFAGHWWTPFIGIALFVSILTFLPPPMALVSCHLAVAGLVLTLAVKLWRRYRSAGPTPG
ncbi:hypothetical protein SAMN04488540_102319 [Ferrimonas sediminum]|uniref:Uncharacterized protein n=1 Tax=Ferrimonas sediminum TaxID=718193 RepID=A0A1G8MAL4_9GAMM|nr:hypothetical protein [Ferrimonas sediminum]SDI64923.1 hypothetical protein SAMN04488540_102319 [Ferrimonas sediminum]